jgi:hypothetical protein
LRRAIRLAAIFARRLDIGGGEWGAVVELDALSQLHFHRVGIDGCKRLREFEYQPIGLLRLHWRARQIAENEAFNDQLTEIGVRGRIPVAGQGLGAEKAERSTLCRECGIHEEVGIDPPKAKRCGTRSSAKQQISAIDHIVFLDDFG